MRDRYTEAPSRQIIAVHAYFDLDRQILWVAATGDIPEIRRQILDILMTEFSESESD